MRAPLVWADVIGEISDDYKNATISLLDPSLVTSTFDVETNAFVQVGNPVVAEGINARVQPVRLAVDTRASSTGNPSSEVRIRVQIPRTAYSGKIQRGWLIRVTQAERNPELLNLLFMVDSDVNSSWRASHTVEATVSVENDANWAAVPFISGTVESDSEPLAGAVVRAFEEVDGLWLFRFAATTDAEGTYQLRGTGPSATYAIVTSKTGYVTSYYDGASDFDTADAVAHNATGVDFDLMEV
jgi:hypothetical protein